MNTMLYNEAVHYRIYNAKTSTIITFYDCKHPNYQILNR